MAESTVDFSDPSVGEALRQFDRAQIKKLASHHLVLVLGALTLWGAAATWSATTGWAIAEFAAIVNAVIAGFVIPSTLHEWGHFAGARASGAKSPVFEEPRGHYFIFDFPIAENDTRQFSWMSWGGIVAPSVVLLLGLLFIPVESTSAMVLLATLVSRAVSVAAFEVPIVQAAEQSGDPSSELGKAVAAGTLAKSRKIGIAAGAAFFALLWVTV